MNDHFYKAFEDRYRGTHEEITNRLMFYAPFLECLKQHFPQGACIDLGSGRGEWLSILKKYDFQARGSDLNADMVSLCNDLGLDVTQGDIFQALSTLPDHSQALVSAFHLVEHLSSEQLEKLISEAHRVLKPGGLLVMETPNPENFSVGAFKFYMDPTHLRPIHPQFLRFLTEHQGFTKTMIAGLQEWPRLHQQNEIGVFDVLWGPSADYAVIAQKTSEQIEDEKLNTLFATEFGISSEVITNRYDAQLRSALKKNQDLAEQNQALILVLQSNFEQSFVLRLERFLRRKVRALIAKLR